MNEPATTEQLEDVAAMAKRWMRYLIAAIGIGGIGGMLTAGYGTVAAAQEVPALKRRMSQMELNVYFLCLMQEQEAPAARAKVEATLKIPVTCRPPLVEVAE